MIELNKIYNEDCLETMKRMPDEFLPVVIADPPYGISYQSAWRIDKSKWKPKIANDETPFTEWLLPLFNKMKNGGRLICFYRWDVQDEFLEQIETAGFTIKSQIVWDKIAHGMGDLNGEFAPQHELMIYATKDRYEFKGIRPKTIYRVPKVPAEKLQHPNEKPFLLIQKLINDISEAHETITDFFMGSGTTAIAALKEKRNFIGSEISKNYCDIANIRIKNFQSQTVLF